MRALTVCTAGLLLVLTACGGKKPSAGTTDQQDSLQKDGTKVFRTHFDTQKFVGEYMGAFGRNTLILNINYVNGNNVSGYNIVKGNRRNIKGVLEDKGDKFFFRLEEPGSNEYDGTFEFTIDTSSLKADGKWTPLDAAKTGGKTYLLEKRSDTGQPDGFAGVWYLDNFRTELKTDGTGIAKGGYENSRGEWVETEIRCTWIDNKDGITIEWAKNPVFKVSTMRMKYSHPEGDDSYEEYLEGSGYTMYRYY
jgi:hypothetical protein